MNDVIVELYTLIMITVFQNHFNSGKSKQIILAQKQKLFFPNCVSENANAAIEMHLIARIINTFSLSC